MAPEPHGSWSSNSRTVWRKEQWPQVCFQRCSQTRTRLYELPKVTYGVLLASDGGLWTCLAGTRLCLWYSWSEHRVTGIKGTAPGWVTAQLSINPNNDMPTESCSWVFLEQINLFSFLCRTLGRKQRKEKTGNMGKGGGEEQNQSS